MKFLMLMMGLFLITACNTQPTQQYAPTPECMNYRGMMTAPMPPDAIERLRLKCEASEKNRN